MRKKRLKRIRYQITQIKRIEDKIGQKKLSLGWRAYISDLDETQLSLQQAMLSYRKQFKIEQVFQKLKSRLNIAPLFVKTDEQIRGLSHLLSLGARILTLIEFVVRTSLQKQNASMTGIIKEAPKRSTQTPTVHRILKAFSNLTLTLIHTAEGLQQYHITPLSALQHQILQSLQIDPNYYYNLKIKHFSSLFTNL